MYHASSNKLKFSHGLMALPTLNYPLLYSWLLPLCLAFVILWLRCNKWAHFMDSCEIILYQILTIVGACKGTLGFLHVCV